MNHLAHALLADPGGDEFALGSALGDFHHGPPSATWPAAREAGLRFHRSVDRFTDAHPEVVAARNLFLPPLRRYAGILLDVWFDRLLIRDWSHYCPEPLSAFSQRWLALLDHYEPALPPALGRFLGWMHGHGLPAGYGDDATLAAVLRALARRLSRPSPLADALPALYAREGALQRHFDVFFPELVAFAQVQRHARLHLPPSGHLSRSPL